MKMDRVRRGAKLSLSSSDEVNCFCHACHLAPYFAPRYLQFITLSR
jgi:hypothetical protein